MTKNGGKSVALFRQKRQICQLSAFPGTFGGRAILKHISQIKFVVNLEIFSLLGAIRDEKLTKKSEKSAALFRQKRQICQLSAFHGTFWGRAILKHIFEIKFVVYLENFSLVGGIRDEKMTKTVEKARRFSAKRER